MISPLNIQAEFADLRKRFEADPAQSTFNALVYGEVGTGKTYLLSTCRKPVLIDSFDKGGSKCLDPWIKKGEIYVDTRWEAEDPNHPSVYIDWAKEMNRRHEIGFFDQVGTYCIDSCTSWGEAIMNHFLWKSKGSPKAGYERGSPEDYDAHWGPQKSKISNHVNKLTTLPCDFILTGHLKAIYKDKKKEVLEGYKLNVTGDLKALLPTLFDEIYITRTRAVGPSQKEKWPRGIKYYLQTVATGDYTARSRLAVKGDFEVEEEPNIKRLLKKAGYSTEDKPLQHEPNQRDST